MRLRERAEQQKQAQKQLSDEERMRLGSENEVIREMLRTDAWRLARTRLQKEFVAAISRLAAGNTMDLEELRFRQGQINVLKTLIETPLTLFDVLPIDTTRDKE